MTKKMMPQVVILKVPFK